MTTLPEFLLDIQHRGLVINTVYDIGAHKGWWTQEMKYSVLPQADFYMFEANPVNEPWLEHLDVPYYIGLLSDQVRDDVKFYAINGTGDSYFQENTTHYDETNFKLMSCTTLDTVVSSTNLPTPNFIKIDTQGSEIDILRGASSIIPNVDLVYLECPIICYNKGAPTMQDYLEYMRSQNFMPIDLLEIHRAEDTLLQVDIMFINIATKARIYGQNPTVKV
jgi:FkbM family methyltransferase